MDKLVFETTMNGLDVVVFGECIGCIDRQHGFFISAGITTQNFTIITPKMLEEIRKKSIEVVGRDF